MREHATVPRQAALQPQPLPFSIFITTELSLLQIASSRGVSLTDLRRENPLLASQDCAAPLPIGTVVELPPTLFLRGTACGSSFEVSEMIDRIQAVHARLDQLPQPPPPRVAPAVAPPLRMLLNTLASETKDQVGKLVGDEELLKREFGMDWATARVSEVLNTQRLDDTMDDVLAKFATTGLYSLGVDQRSLLQKGPVVRPGREVLDPPVRPPHSINDFVLDWTFLKPQSVTHFDESWSLRSTQSLLDLEAVIECPNGLSPFPRTANSFFFINGVFFINDVNPDAIDLSLPIRTFDPSKQGRPNGAFGRCPVRSMTSALSDIDVKMHELCVYRHLGCCDHYFYLQGLRAVVREEDTAHSRRLTVAPRKPRKCDMCSLLPACIITYNDCLAPQNPALFCSSCFATLHVTEDGQEEEYGYLKFQLPVGKYL